MPKDNSTSHHCPLKEGKKGNCRPSDKHCKEHQVRCLHDKALIHLRTRADCPCNRLPDKSHWDCPKDKDLLE